MKAADYLPQIAALEARIGPLERELEALRRQHRDAVSREFIALHGITRSQVHESTTAGLPYFGHVLSFADYLRTLPERRRWYEWNGCLYETSELMAGRMKPEPEALFEHVPT